MLARERLVHWLDLAVFCHLLAVYTLDETLWRAVVATLAHSDMRRPQQGPFPGRFPARFRPLLAVLVTQLVAVLTHIWGSLPSSTSDGYLHGTIITNFIGVLPASRPRLVGLDLVVVGLELAMFASACDPNRKRQVPVDILDPTETLEAMLGLAVDELGWQAFSSQEPEGAPGAPQEADETSPQSIWDYL